MHADPAGVLTGAHFIDGDHACCEGAIAAGCRFVAGYPITPSTEVVERIALRFPEVGGVFIQMEDELASSIAIAGAAWAGARAMTVTSGPGFSLMMEHIGYAVMTETPMVIVNVQRGGPSTGLPTLPAQSDMMQARWGSHGDYELIAVCPHSPQECFDLTIKAFNLSEQYRVPVLVMMDECVGHMMERVVIPPAEEIEIYPRRYTTAPIEEYLPYAPGDDLVPAMARAGSGYRFHVTGLTHDERGYPEMNAAGQARLIRRLIDKIKKNVPALTDVVEDGTADAEAIVMSYGITSRVVLPAVAAARARGHKIGVLRLRVVWPFPEHVIRALAARVKAFVVPELNMGQMVREVERCAGGTRVVSVPHAGGAVHDPNVIRDAIVEALR
ncbi:MAG: 2-oxoacid:acceptor oxidoreductase subunit alpha [Planctomycetes bacterium]|nr:2-oxoacid:acceptor oxidoreductase subunit alpha [Planctomycetota bacterium]